MKKYLIISLVFILCGCSSIPKAYITADRETYRAIAPEYAGYLQKDETLSASQKILRQQTLDSWERRISAAEEGLYEKE